KEFLKFLEGKVERYAIDIFCIKHYSQLSYRIQQFCECVKTRFTGESEFRKYSLDIEKTCPALKQYVSSSARNELEEEKWEININFETVKNFFDPVVSKILQLISIQLDKSKCTVMFLVGGFSESKYLQQRIKQRFSECKIYGIAVYPKFQEGNPLSCKQSDGHVEKFCLMAKRGVQVEVNQQFFATMLPNEPKQTEMLFKHYYTAKKIAQFCDEPEMYKLGEFHVDLPDTHLGLDRPVTLYLYFGAMEIIAIAKNETNRKVHQTIFKLDL
ncbi:36725_t:CDS:2, partial [Gigaspora margarita]